MPATQPANTGIGNGGTGANTGAGGYSVTVSPNGQMTITQGGRPVYTGPVQGTSLTYNQSGQLVGFNASKSSPITTISYTCICRLCCGHYITLSLKPFSKASYKYKLIWVLYWLC